MTFANAGQIQSQINNTQEGDLFIAGSKEELDPVQDMVEASVDLVKHIPVLAVQSGNPEAINGLSDLTKGGMDLVIGEPESTPIGKIAKKALTDFGVFDSVHITATMTTAPQLATALELGEADAAIVWKENCGSDKIEIVQTEDMNAYIKVVPAATLNCSVNKDEVELFLNWLSSEEVEEIWTSYGYEMAE